MIESGDHVAMLQEKGGAVLEPETSGATNLTLEVTNILLLFFRAVNRTLRK